jgi:hypothetical protein
LQAGRDEHSSPLYESSSNALRPRGKLLER